MSSQQNQENTPLRDNQNNDASQTSQSNDQQLVRSQSGNVLADKTGQDSTVKPKFVAQFLTLDISFVSNLPAPVLQKITARAEEMENMKSQQMLDQMNYGMYIKKRMK